MIKKILKWFGLLVLVILVGAGSFAAHEWYADKPFMFRAYLDRMMVKRAFDSPEMLTSLGFLESMGIKGHNAHLDDVHPDRTDELFADMKAFGEGLLQYDDEDLDPQQRLSKEIALYLANMLADAEPYRFHTYPANGTSGIQSDFPSFMNANHQVNTVEDAEHYLSRMSELPRKHEQYLLGLKLRESRDIIPPRFVIERVLEQIEDFVATPAQENILYTSLADKLDEAEEIDETQAADILRRVEASIEENVYPAYDQFINYFSELEAKAGDDHGYWHLPDGEAAYRLALRLFTTTSYTPDEIHELGLAEVERIQGEMLAIFEEEGVDISRGYTDAMAAYSSRPEFYYEDSDEGRQQILDDYQAMLDEFDAGLDDAFNIRPKAGMEVLRVPEFREKTAPGAYYSQPSLDGTRPGRFYANLYDIKATPKFGMRTLAVHEGIPGHHFQVAIAMELEGMPLIRRFSLFTAYVEGWALYAERVAWEQGLLPTNADNIGRLTAELFRAVRLVVDTGIHHRRWTREEAIEYMLANTGMAESDVISEIERYIVWPGQATAYKVGMLKILELRQRAMDELGDAFDLRDFHDVVLKNGAVPLDILESIVDDYIDETSSGKRTIALTFDDATRGDDTVFTGDERTARLIDELAKAGVDEAMFFVTTGNVERAAGHDRIRAYADAGHTLANHSHSHNWLWQTDSDEYIADVDKAIDILSGFDNVEPFYRFPYLDEGREVEKRDRLRAALASRGLKNGYVTIETYDWSLDRLLQEAHASGTSFEMDAVRDLYVDVITKSTEFFDALAQEVLGRSPHHVLLLHENDIAALFIGDLVAELRNRGFRIIPATEAFEDPIADEVPDTLFLGQGRIAALAHVAGWKPSDLVSPTEDEEYLRRRFEKEVAAY